MLDASRTQSTSRGFLPADVTVHPPNQTLPGSKGPLEKGTAGYYLKMKYAASEEHFHSGMRGSAVYFYKDGMGWKLAVNLEESCACSSPLAWHCHTWHTALRWATWGGWEPLRVEEESLSCSH